MLRLMAARASARPLAANPALAAGRLPQALAARFQQVGFHDQQRQEQQVSPTRSWREKLSSENLKRFAKRYGLVAGVVHSSVYVTTLGALYTALDCGVDLVGLLSQLPVIDVEMLNANAAAGQLAVAYAATMLTGPVRAVVTVATTPHVAAVWDAHKPRPAPLWTDHRRYFCRQLK